MTSPYYELPVPLAVFRQHSTYTRRILHLPWWELKYRCRLNEMFRFTPTMFIPLHSYPYYYSNTSHKQVIASCLVQAAMQGLLRRPCYSERVNHRTKSWLQHLDGDYISANFQGHCFTNTRCYKFIHCSTIGISDRGTR